MEIRVNTIEFECPRDDEDQKPEIAVAWVTLSLGVTYSIKGKSETETGVIRFTGYLTNEGKGRLVFWKRVRPGGECIPLFQANSHLHEYLAKCVRWAWEQVQDTCLLQKRNFEPNYIFIVKAGTGKVTIQTMGAVAEEATC